MSSLAYHVIKQPGGRKSPVTIMESPAEVLHLSEEDFDAHLHRMDEKDLLITATFLQREMSHEQEKFNDLHKSFEETEESDPSKAEILASNLLFSQERLKELMSRTQKCFLQRNELNDHNGQTPEPSADEENDSRTPSPTSYEEYTEHQRGESIHNGTNGTNGLTHSDLLNSGIKGVEIIPTDTSPLQKPSKSELSEHSGSIANDAFPSIVLVSDHLELPASEPQLDDIPECAIDELKPNRSSCDLNLIKYDSSPQFPRVKIPETAETMDFKAETKPESPSRQSSSTSKSSSDSYVSANDGDEHITVSRFVSETTFTVRNIRQELNRTDSNPEVHRPETKVSVHKQPEQQIHKNGHKDHEISKAGAVMEIENMVKDLEASRSDTSAKKVSPSSGKYTHSSQLKPQPQNNNEPVDLPKVSQLMKNFEQNSSSRTVSNGSTQPSQSSRSIVQKQSGGRVTLNKVPNQKGTSNVHAKSKSTPPTRPADTRSLLMDEIRKGKPNLQSVPSTNIVSSSQPAKEGSRVSWADKGSTQGKLTISSSITGSGTDMKWGSNSGFISPVPPALESTEGFSADDKIKTRTTLRDWDPVKLLQDLYRVHLTPDNLSNCQSYINMEGYMEKLPLNKKKATLLKTWKRRYFRTKEGCLYYYEDHLSQTPIQEEYETSDNTTERSSGIVQLGGGNVEALEDRIIGIDDGRGHFLTLRCSTDDEMGRWILALKSQTVEDVAPTWVQPVLLSPPSSKRKVVVVDIGSCSVRAGILGEKPSLPQLFFPSLIATSKTGNRIFGFDALKPDIRSSHLLSYLVRPAFRLDKTTFDMDAMEPLFTKIFAELKVDPSECWVMFSSPGNFSDNIKYHFMELFINRFKLRGANIVSQTLLSLYSYQTSTGVFVNIGECLEIVPVTDGYVVDGGAARQPYGGHRVAEYLNSSFTESRYRFFTDVEFQIVRLAVERSCYVAVDFKEEQKNCMADPTPFKKTIHLESYDLPSGTWQSVTHDLSRFKSSEGLFDTSLWEMDNPSLPKLIQNAVLASPMDTRREMWRNICLSGGVTQMPGFAERLRAELTKMVPSSVRVQIRASPHRYHSAFIGACTMASFNTWEQSCISADEWKKQGMKCLKKWHIN